MTDTILADPMRDAAAELLTAVLAFEELLDELAVAGVAVPRGSQLEARWHYARRQIGLARRLAASHGLLSPHVTTTQATT